MSCKCQSCGDLYKVDLIIPDKLWEIIKPKGKVKGAGLLCGKCIIKFLELINEYRALHLVGADNSPSPNKSSLRLPDVKQCIEHAMSKLGDDYFNVTPSMLIGCVRRFIASELEGKNGIQKHKTGIN